MSSLPGQINNASEYILPPVTKTSLYGIDNPASTATADEHPASTATADEHPARAAAANAHSARAAAANAHSPREAVADAHPASTATANAHLARTAAANAHSAANTTTADVHRVLSVKYDDHNWVEIAQNRNSNSPMIAEDTHM